MPDNTITPASIAPWLSVNDSAKEVSFYKAAFNAIETYRLEDPDGNAVVKLSVGDSVFWVSDAADKSNEPENVGGNTVRMILTVSDPDTMFKTALAAGAVEVFPVSEAHGWRLGRLIDVCGLHWEIGKQLG